MPASTLLNCSSDVEEQVARIQQAVLRDDRFAWARDVASTTSLTFLARRSRKLRFDRDDEMSQLLENDSLPQSIWPAALPFAEWLVGSAAAAAGGDRDSCEVSAPPLMWQGKRVLELGSGVGICGLAAAAATPAPECVVVSDVSPVSLALMALSVEANERCGVLRSGCVRVAHLKWGDLESLEAVVHSLAPPHGAPCSATHSNIKGAEARRFDIVLGSDIFYFNNSLTAGLRTAWHALSDGGLFLCASVVRSERMECELDSVPCEEWAGGLLWEADALRVYRWTRCSREK